MLGMTHAQLWWPNVVRYPDVMFQCRVWSAGTWAAYRQVVVVYRRLLRCWFHTMVLGRLYRSRWACFVQQLLEPQQRQLRAQTRSEIRQLRAAMEYAEDRTRPDPRQRRPWQ